jgi:hypothetical protein
MNENATIRLNRKSQYQGSLSKFKVFIDGSLAGKIKDGETIEYSVAPGRHTIYIKPGFDWAGSRKLILDLAPGQIAELDCGNRNGFWAVLLPLLAPFIRYFSPTGKENLFVYVFFGLALVLYLAASFRPSFFVYLTEGE